MKQKFTMFTLAIGIALALTLTLGGLWAPRLAPDSAAAQTAPTRTKVKDSPLSGPMSKDDPRAKLNPELLEVPPVPFPADAHQGAPIDPEYGSSEASFDVATGKETIDLQLQVDQDLTGRAAAGARDLSFPGSIGPDANIDDSDSSQKSEGRGDDPGNGYSIFGPDNRTKITNTTAFPWRTMTKLFMTYPNGARGGCSGTLIASKYVLTAGHCVYSHGNGGWARSIEVIPGLSGTYRPYGSAYSTYMRSYVGWTRDRDANYDMALITLDRSIGSSTGWLGYAYLPSINGVTGNLAGYPGDRDSGLGLYYHFGPILSSTSLRASYTIDTFNGQSGSSVYRLLNSQRHVFVVHTSGGATSNSGTRITSQRFSDLQSWIASGT